MNFKDAFLVDDETKDAEWFDCEAVDADGETHSYRLLIAVANNPKFQAAYTKLMEPYEAQARRRALPVKVTDRIMVQAMARGLLLDWEGLELDGKDFPYSVANAEQLLGMSREFREEVANYAQDKARFRQEVLEDGIKNSDSVSNGS